MIGRTRRLAAFTLAAALCAPSATWAQAAPAIDYATLPHRVMRPALITYPDYAVRPSRDQVMAAYPPKALAARVNGRAEVECQVTLEGRVANCAVLWEGPEGYGFAGAAQTVVQQVVMVPMLRDGKPIEGGVVRFPFVFAAFPARPAAPQPPRGARALNMPPQASVVLSAGHWGVVGFTQAPADFANWSPRATFLDLDIRRGPDGTLEVQTIDVLPAPGPREYAFAVGRHRLDCVRKTAQGVGTRYFDEAGTPRAWFPYSPVRAAVPFRLETFEGQAFEAACAGASALQTVEGPAQALAVARGWPKQGS